jgi:tetratricopeptide (TPR) repeat protein
MTEEQKQFDQALDLYFDKKYLEALPLFQSLEKKKLTPYLSVQVLRRMGGCLSYLGNPEDGMKYLLKALKLSKKITDDGEEDVWVIQSIAEAYGKMNMFDKAFALYKKIIQKVKEPENYEYLMGSYEDMLEEYRIYKLKDISALKKMNFFKNIDKTILEIEEEVKREEAELIKGKQKFEV